jgi:hypothetical protein
MKLEFLFAIVYLIAVISIGGCQESKAQMGVSVQAIQGPGGVTCYVIFQGSDAKAGNCK